MKKQIYYVIALLIVVATALILILGNIQKQEPEEQLPDIQVTYSMTGGIVGWTKILTINNNGTVVLEENTFSEEGETTKSIQLSNKELKEFKELINNANVFSFKDTYFCEENCPTDLPSENFGFTIDGEKKSVSIYISEEMPQELEQILQEIQSIENKFN